MTTDQISPPNKSEGASHCVNGSDPHALSFCEKRDYFEELMSPRETTQLDTQHTEAPRLKVDDRTRLVEVHRQSPLGMGCERPIGEAGISTAPRVSPRPFSGSEFLLSPRAVPVTPRDVEEPPKSARLVVPPLPSLAPPLELEISELRQRHQLQQMQLHESHQLQLQQLQQIQQLQRQPSRRKQPQQRQEIQAYADLGDSREQQPLDRRWQQLLAKHEHKQEWLPHSQQPHCQGQLVLQQVPGLQPAPEPSPREAMHSQKDLHAGNLQDWVVDEFSETHSRIPTAEHEARRLPDSVVEALEGRVSRMVAENAELKQQLSEALVLLSRSTQQPQSPSRAKHSARCAYSKSDPVSAIPTPVRRRSLPTRGEMPHSTAACRKPRSSADACFTRHRPEGANAAIRRDVLIASDLAVQLRSHREDLEDMDDFYATVEPTAARCLGASVVVIAFAVAIAWLIS